LLVSCGPLAGQRLAEHFFGENLADVQEEIFDISQGGAPGRPCLPVELIDKVFGNAFDIRADLLYQRTSLFLACHLPILSHVMSKVRTGSQKPV
jgi:hypothetical protein